MKPFILEVDDQNEAEIRELRNEELERVGGSETCPCIVAGGKVLQDCCGR